MIKLFGQTDRLFASNGDLVIQPLKAVIYKAGIEGEIGEYYLALETDLSYVNDLTSGRIIVANTPTGDQAFRIRKVEKTKSKLLVTALHVFYDADNYLIEDSYVVNMDANDALDHLNSATEPQSGFVVSSDVGVINSYRCVRKSLTEAVSDVIGRWGGYLERDNFRFSIKKQMGTDNGVTVRYRKNLKDISCVEDWDDVVTKLMPVGYDGIMLDSVDPTASKYVLSETQYALPYVKCLSFDQDVNSEDYQDEDGNVDEAAYRQALVDDLRRQAQAYVSAHSIPQVSYTLQANLEHITDIGDTIQVIDERLGVNIMTNVIAYEYDCVSQRYLQVEFGNFKQTIVGLVSNMTKAAEQVAKEQSEAVRVILGEELKTATDKIWGALGNSYVIYDGDKILVVDSLPKETATNVMMINSGGIGFSNTGINGTFSSAWTIDGTMDMQAINVINLTASLIRGGTLKLGSALNESGILELYDESNNLIGEMTSGGLKMYALDGSYVIMNGSEGFAGYNAQGQKIYWVSQDEFHMRKSVVEDEITLLGKVRFIPITLYDGNHQVTSDGIGLVSWLD